MSNKNKLNKHDENEVKKLLTFKRKLQKEKLNEEEEIFKFLSCDDCNFATCEQCTINYNMKRKIKNYIDWLIKSNEELDKECTRLEKKEVEMLEKL